MNKALGKIFYKDLFALLISIGIFYLLFLGSHGIVDPDEGRYSEAAREMLASGNFITPYVDGVPFFDKPILFYWLQALSMVLFGVNEWSIRLFPMLAGVGSCIVVYIVGNKLYGRLSGILSALILSVMPMFFGIAHFANMDIEIAFWVTGATGFGLIAVDQADAPSGRRWMWLAFAFAGCGFLTKGLIGLVFPVMVLGVWVIVWNRWKLLPKLSLPISLLIFCMIALPWLIVVSIENLRFLYYFFIYEQFTRFVGGHFNSIQPLWFYPELILGGLIPWIWFFGQSVVMHVKQLNSKTPGHHRSAILLLWPLLVLIFFSIPASKLPGYIAPVFPPLALLLGTYLVTRWSSLRWRRGFYGVIIVFVLIEVSLMGVMRFFPINTVKPLITVVQPHIKPSDVVVSYNNYFPGVPLYLQRRVLVAGDWSDTRSILSRDGWPQMFYIGIQHDPSAKRWILTYPEFWAMWCGKQTVWAFAPMVTLGDFATHPCPYRVAARSFKSMVLINQNTH
jgi:4-amino-4-deoxy-L-arabinose transferase-like glycosyltransferase